MQSCHPAPVSEDEEDALLPLPLSGRAKIPRRVYDDDDDDEEEEIDLSAALYAMLARRCKAHVSEPSIATLLRESASMQDPRQLLRALAASDVGRKLLMDKASELRQPLTEETPAAHARRHAALAGVLELIDLRSAETHLRMALVPYGIRVPAALATSNPPLSPLGDEALREACEPSTPHPPIVRAVLSTLVRLRRQLFADEANAPSPTTPPPSIAARPVARAPANLSVDEFERLYAATGTPVVLPLPPGAGCAWDFAHLRQRIGSRSAELRRRKDGSAAWAGLETFQPHQPMRVHSFIDAVLEDDATALGVTDGAADPPYLFDWSLPQHAPDLVEEIVVPRFFARDLLQRTPAGSLLREAWPSLFIGPRASRCALHVDAYGTHFWMLALEGRKAWTLFPRDATPALRPSYAHGHDASFGVDVDAADDAHPTNLSTHQGEWRALERWACVLEPNELLFVPAGCAHAVTNLTPTLAISANFVTPSNRMLAVDELLVAGLQAPPAKALAAHLESTARENDRIPEGAGRDVDLPWASFKRRRGAPDGANEVATV